MSLRDELIKISEENKNTLSNKIVSDLKKDAKQGKKYSYIYEYNDACIPLLKEQGLTVEKIQDPKEGGYFLKISW